MTPDACLRRRTLLLFLIIWGLDVLAAILSIISTLIPAGGPLPADIVVLILYYACSLFTLFAGFAGLGAAFFYMGRGSMRGAARLLLLTAGGYLLTLLITGVAESLRYLNLDYVDYLLSYIFSALINALMNGALYFVALLLAYLLLFHRKQAIRCRTALLGTGRLQRAALIGCAVVGLYQLIYQIIDTVSFLTEYWPNVYDSEIATIVADYIFLLGSLFLGYVTANLATVYLDGDEEE